LTILEDNLSNNLNAMSSFCDGADVSLAPHVKTTMSPQFIARQVDAGAWAVTVATPAQARTVRAWGVGRILLANEVVDRDAVAWMGAEMDRDPSFTVYCYVDSVDGVEILEAALAPMAPTRRLPILIEVRAPAGRAGVRSMDEAVRLAAAVASSGHLRLAGVSGFEGVLGASDNVDSIAIVRSYLRELQRIADVLVQECDIREEFIVTAGGSAYLELVPDMLDHAWRAARRIRIVLRSGCYVTHDSGTYSEFRTLMRNEIEVVNLSPALELWSSVLSVPEPGLAILDFGRRDAGIDAGYPVPLHLVSRGSADLEPAPDATVIALNDQHAYLRVHARLGLKVGDRLSLGVSHPCTTFDKWRLIPIVDGDRAVVGAAETHF
jgi:D-serine deaminase-like pyridoxal phosphate-dependent protein